LEIDLSSPSLEGIERELQLVNINLAEANDIALLALFTPSPPDLDNESRKAMSALRQKMVQRATDRADM
jgi:hypothetical protein